MQLAHRKATSATDKQYNHLLSFQYNKIDTDIQIEWLQTLSVEEIKNLGSLVRKECESEHIDYDQNPMFIFLKGFYLKFYHGKNDQHQSQDDTPKSPLTQIPLPTEKEKATENHICAPNLNKTHEKTAQNNHHTGLSAPNSEVMHSTDFLSAPNSESKGPKYFDLNSLTLARVPQVIFKPYQQDKVRGFQKSNIIDHLIRHRQYSHIYIPHELAIQGDRGTEFRHKVLMYKVVSGIYRDRKEELAGKKVDCIDITLDKTRFDLVSKNNHEHLKKFLSEIGIRKIKNHGPGQSSKYEISDESVFKDTVKFECYRVLQNSLKRLDRRRLRPKVNEIKSTHEKLQWVGLEWLENKLLPLDTIIKNRPDGLDDDKFEHSINHYRNMLHDGISKPGQGDWHRVYNNFTNLPKWIRHQLYISEVDLKSAQLNFLLWMAWLNEAITDEEYIEYAGDAYRNLFPEMNLPEAKQEVTETYLSSSVKKMMETQVYQILEKKLPKLNQFAVAIKTNFGRNKSHQYTDLSERLTQIEAHIIFKAMSKVNSQKLPCSALFDAICCNPCDSQIVKDAIDSVLKEYGIRTWAEVE